MEFGPNSVLFEHEHSREEQCLVLEGEVLNHGVKMGPGDFFRAEPESYTESGAKDLIIAGIGDY